MTGTDTIFYWDTCVFIAWLKDEKRPSGEMDGVRAVIEGFKKRHFRIFTSVITFTEVTEAKVGAGVINMFEDLFKRPDLGRINVDPRVAKLARDLRDYYSARPEEFNNKTLSVPDSIHLATAILRYTSPLRHLATETLRYTSPRRHFAAAISNHRGPAAWGRCP